MGRLARFLVALLLGLALLSWGGYTLVRRTTQRWFLTDLAQRSRLAVDSARQSLGAHWSAHDGPHASLADITRDDRVMGAAACASGGLTLGATEAYPSGLTCAEALTHAADPPDSAGRPWWTVRTLASGSVHFTVVPFEAREGDLGAVVIAQDLSFLGRRDAAARDLVLLAFFVLSLGASAVTLLAARVAWRGWTAALRRALAGEASREFQPLLRDVREQIDRLAREREADAGGGRWSAERLKSTLVEHLHGERVVLLANREPYIHERVGDAVKVLHPASGLVTALEPVLRACSGVWVAHGSGSADRETVDAHARVRVPPGDEAYDLRRVWLTDQEEQGYYYGFSNEGLWPLCHVAHERPTFRAEDWEQYVRVNRRFADAVCEEVHVDDPIVLVQDYHFALAPAMIRERLPRATILTFWHIPWPNAERFGICPWREQILEGLLGSSILGFHTQQHCNHFTDAVDAYLERRIDREERSIVQGARRTLVRAYPISIEWPVRWLDAVPPREVCAAEVRRELGLGPDALLGVGIDRLDYTKGIEERLEAVDRLLEDHPEHRGRFTFAQLAAPSRTRIERYRLLNERVEALAASINARWSRGDWRPIVLLRKHHEPPAVFRFYRAADVCYVSSLHDGMNLVAKEFVAARDDEQGVLVLSRFTGAARELTEALLVNPYDLREAAQALAAALSMPADEQRERMRAMRRLVSAFNVYRWAGRMLVDAAEYRRRERVWGRLSTFDALRRAEAV